MCNYFESVSMDQMLFSSVFQTGWWPFCSAEWNHLSNFGRRPFREKYLNLDQQFRRCCLKVFLFLALAAILFSKAKVLHTKDDHKSSPLSKNAIIHQVGGENECNFLNKTDLQKRNFSLAPIHILLIDMVILAINKAVSGDRKCSFDMNQCVRAYPM